MRLPLKWHGGKWYLRRWIRAHFLPHTKYAEGCFGGGAVLLDKEHDGISEVVNDINGELTNFWDVLSDKAAFVEMMSVLSVTPFSEEVWQRSLTIHPLSHRDPAAAAAFLVRVRQSRQGLQKCFATSTARVRRGMNENVAAWLSAIDGLPEIHQRMQRVLVRRSPVVQFIKQEDGPDVLFYLDPPYPKDTRVVPDAYVNEMTDAQHEELLETLAGIEGKFVLSSYQNPIYETAREVLGWHRSDMPIDNKASSAKVKPTKIESLYMNFTPPEISHAHGPDRTDDAG